MKDIRIEEDTTTGQTCYRVQLYAASGEPIDKIGAFDTAAKAQYTAQIVETALQHIRSACDPTLMYYLQRSNFEAPLYFEARHEPQQWWKRETQKEDASWPYWIVEHDWSGYGIHHLGYYSSAQEAQQLCEKLNQAVTRIQKAQAAGASTNPASAQ